MIIRILNENGDCYVVSKDCHLIQTPFRVVDDIDREAILIQDESEAFKANFVDAVAVEGSARREKNRINIGEV